MDAIQWDFNKLEEWTENVYEGQARQMWSPTTELKYLYSTAKLGTDWIESRSSEGCWKTPEDGVSNMSQQCTFIGFCGIIDYISIKSYETLATLVRLDT